MHNLLVSHVDHFTVEFKVVGKTRSEFEFKILTKPTSKILKSTCIEKVSVLAILPRPYSPVRNLTYTPIALECLNSELSFSKVNLRIYLHIIGFMKMEVGRCKIQSFSSLKMNR